MVMWSIIFEFILRKNMIAENVAKQRHGHVCIVFLSGPFAESI